MNTSECLAGEAATALFVAVRHLERLQPAINLLHDWALQTSFEAAQQALSERAVGANAFDDPLVRRTADLVMGATVIQNSLEEILSEVRPMDDSIQVEKELADRARLQLPNH